MKILIADDDPSTRFLMQIILSKWGYDVVIAEDGDEACRILESKESPSLAILDWMMPGMSGIDVIKRVRQTYRGKHFYILLLTARDRKEDVVTGLQAGADDYITKPIDKDVLRARIQVGDRIVHLQMDLAKRVKQLKEALNNVKRLQGLLPICSYCKKVRDDQNYWHQVEVYITEHTDAQFSHSICPECKTALMKELEKKKKQKQKQLKEATI